MDPIILKKIYHEYIGSMSFESEEVINTLLALSKNELEKNNDEPIISSNRVKVGVMMAGQDGELYVCKRRSNGNHYWYKN